MIYATLDNFYLSDEQLLNSPSRLDGVDEGTENQLRQFGCDLIQEAGILLKLPQAVMATAQVLLQRFYCKKSLRKLDVKVASMGAFWLGAKLEEVIEIDAKDKLRIRDVLTVFYRLIRRREGRTLDILDPHSKKFEELKAEVVRAERLILRSFGFIVHVEQPHRFVLSYAHLMDWSREQAQEAWNIANDSLRTTLCVRFKAEVVACGILFLAARRLKLPMPESPPWWEAFEATEHQVHCVCAILLDLYSRPRAEYVVLARNASKPQQSGHAPSPKTANTTPVMRSPAPEVSVAASGAAASVGHGAASDDAKRSEGPVASTANGEAEGDQPAAGSEGAAPAANGAHSPSSKGPRPSSGKDAERSGSQVTKDRRRSRSRDASHKRSRSPEERRGREGKHKHRHRSRSRDLERDGGRGRREYDERRDGSRHRERRREEHGREKHRSSSRR